MAGPRTVLAAAAHGSLVIGRLASLCLAFALTACATGPSVIAVPSETTDVRSDPIVLYAFVGRKVSVQAFEPQLERGEVLLDSAWIADYEVLAQHHGPELPERIRFEAYDHYGYPGFARQEVALIYAMESGGRLYHAKYAYDRVYPTREGGWATCGVTLNWNERRLLRTERIDFASEELRKECSRGNLAQDVVRARIEAGQFDR